MTGVVVWITGLPSSGKTTFAVALRDRLQARGRTAILLDGDDVRAALVPVPDYGPDGRAAFYETLGNLALLLAGQGLTVLVAATGHLRAFRERVRRRAPRFLEVFVDVPPETCAARDPKGLWKQAREGGAPALPGVTVGYERPRAPELIASGGEDSSALDKAVALLLG